jgi:hypothetical protein
VQGDGELKSLKEIVDENFPCCKPGMFTVEMGDHLVDINTEMYNSNKGTADVLDKNGVPSLIIATTTDMEFAHISGYEGRTIPYDDCSAFEAWSKQIKDTETAAALNPLRLFPLLSYDPRRYRLPDEKLPKDNGCETWDKLFARIVGCRDSADEINKIWFGFCLNPFLGFRPFDEFCEHLPRFYKKCADNHIPILARCVPGGIITHDAKVYKDFDDGKAIERTEKSKKRHEMILKEGLSSHQNVPLSSNMYCGKERIVDDSDLDHFYGNYGHPRNWIPVLKYFPDLRLCLGGFGGSRLWQYISASELATDDEVPGREWIACINKLTRYKNVYADISGLNIYDPLVRFTLLRLLDAIKYDHEEFKHLKYKLIFGSDWYLTHLMYNMNYSDYCREFKEVFDYVDESGRLWERVSLINPWNFYVLSGDKINTMHNELKNPIGNLRVNITMLDKMKEVFDGSEETGSLVKYIYGRNKAYPAMIPEKPDEMDEDLAAVEMASSNIFGISLAKFTTDNDRAYIRGSPTDSKIRNLEKEPIAGQTRFDCSGWVAYCINKVYRNVFGKGLIINSSFYQNIIQGNTDAMIKYADEHGGIRTLKPTYRDKLLHTHSLKRMCNNCELKPQIGDLALWEGHVEIVIEVDGEKFRTSGSSGQASRNDPVPTQKPLDGMQKYMFNNSADASLRSWGTNGRQREGVFLGFWTIELSNGN